MDPCKFRDTNHGMTHSSRLFVYPSPSVCPLEVQRQLKTLSNIYTLFRHITADYFQRRNPPEADNVDDGALRITSAAREILDAVP